MQEKILTFDEILAAADHEERALYVPEWGGSVVIQTISRARLDTLRKRATVAGKVDEDLLNQYLFQECLVQPQITGVQYRALRATPAGPIARVEEAMRQLNGLGEEAVAAAEASFPEKSGEAV